MARIWLPAYNMWADTEDPAVQTMLGLDANGARTWDSDPQTTGTPDQYLPGGGDGFATYQTGQAPITADPWNAPLNAAPTLAEDPSGGGTPPATEPPPSGGGGASPPNLSPWTEQFQAPTQRALPGLPQVKPAPAFRFTAPSMEDALSDPGYAFRLQQGQDSLQRWAAARGTLNDSGTAHALVDYGQNAASQEYGNLWNRRYTQARDEYAPEFASWQAGNDRDALGYSTESAWNQRANENDYTNAWNQFIDRENLWKFNVQNALALAGM